MISLRGHDFTMPWLEVVLVVIVRWRLRPRVSGWGQSRGFKPEDLHTSPRPLGLASFKGRPILLSTFYNSEVLISSESNNVICKAHSSSFSSSLAFLNAVAPCWNASVLSVNTQSLNWVRR